MINIIISVKGLQTISDRLYKRVCIAKFITILYITKFIMTNDRYNRYQISNRCQISNKYQIKQNTTILPTKAEYYKNILLLKSILFFVS